MEKERNKHYGVVFNRKSGKIVTTLEHDYGDAFLRMYAMGNLTKANDYVVFSATTGKITGYFEGKGKNDFTAVSDNAQYNETIEYNGETYEYLYKPTGEVNLPKAHWELIQKVYASLGFTFDGVFGYIHEQGFIATHGHGFTMTQVANYSGSAAAITPNQIGLPQTGDAPSIVGFAMLGAAVVACAIIAIRKKIYN